MKKRIAFALVFLLLPGLALANPYRQPSSRYWHSPPSGSWHRPYPAPYYRHHGYYYRPYHHYNDWIVPAAIVGTAVGLMAISASAPPPPPERICRDTYNHYDAQGRFLYSEYVDRPCR